jgi:thiol-disulfide isomerase/thioredoxin
MKLSRTLIVLALIAMLPGLALAADKVDPRVQELEEKVAALETELNERLTAMESSVDAKIASAIEEIAQRETRAAAEFRSISTLVSKGQHKAAKVKMDAFSQKYAGTEAAKQAASVQRELAVIGKKAPTEFAVQKWYAGEGEITSLDGPGTTLVVFWEEWCPHCKREIPKMQATYDRLKADGLKVIALTQITKRSTDETVTAFVAKNKLNFPMAQEPGKIKAYFNVGGIPAAAVVKDGEIVWRGHPARLSDTILKGWL